ncbi:MAG: alpha-amlyase [Bacteroidetes bacterium]|nr:MAG: alpha-amlyase [Bacteroidota bacterium]
MIKFKNILFLFFIFTSSLLPAKGITIDRVDPPYWWTGMKNHHLQLMVHGNRIAETTPVVNYPGVKLEKIIHTQSSNYLFLNLIIDETTKPGTLTINFIKEKKQIVSMPYELKQRDQSLGNHEGFDASDVIYLLMPDRFANGDTTNDDVTGMLEKADRTNPNGRHGGDIKGIENHLDYLTGLGATAVWINPLLENNMPAYSYHGYAMTDFYKVDPRFGSNSDYKNLIRKAHQKGLKVIQDMVFNHCGTNYFWKGDLPTKDWYNQWPEFTRSNYRGGVVTDPHASKSDEHKMVAGWFDTSMADLNQDNELVANYLIQNSIWWIESTGLDGIRQDTYPYPYKDFMAKWMQRILEEYPHFNVVGEAWLSYPVSVAYWMENDRNFDGYHSYLTNVFDFPLMYAISKAFNEPEGWSTGTAELYEIISQDFVYSHPENLVLFADNHDGDRFFSKMGEDLKRFKLAMAFLMTTRGIPQIYYGTEILMTGLEHNGHGDIRKDFPGGWPGDTLNAFVAEGRTKEQNEAFNYLKTLMNWRKNKKVIHTGKLTHYIPQDGVYVYFRYNNTKSVMVLLNNTEEDKTIDCSRFSENLSGYTKGRTVIKQRIIDNLNTITVPAKSPLIIELEK